MKRYSLYLAILLLAFIQMPNAKAQITPNKRMMSFGPQPALEVTLPEASEDLIIDVWKHKMKTFGKVKRNKKAHEYYIENEKVPPINGDKEISVYMIPEDGKAVVFIDLKGNFLSQESPQYDDAVTFLKDFAVDVEKERIEQLIEAQKKTLKSLNKKYKKLTRREKKLKGRIEDAKKTIRESEEELQQNAAKQKEQLEEIDQQEKHLKELEDMLKKAG